jgi:predicted RNA-binding protein associated with RNAse of E/G family
MESSWPPLLAGTPLIIVKLDPKRVEVTRYPGVVIEAGAPAPWVAVQAVWVSREYNLNGLRFIAGDVLHEFFSPADRFNVFSVFSPEGELRGWYANVTHPARLDREREPMMLYWHDLYIDVVALPDGTVVVRDEDELEASGLRTSDPDLYSTIVRTKDEIIRGIRGSAFPFHESSAIATSPSRV